MALLITAFFLLIAVVSIKDGPSDPKYEDNYWACLGIKHDGIRDYDWIVSEFGEPVSTEIEWEAECRTDPSLNQYVISTTHESPEHGKMMFRHEHFAAEPFAGTRSWRLLTITTYNPEHYFGSRRIHVGSTREEVVRAYKKIFPSRDYPLGDEFYEGDPWAENIVTFTYDENDVVTSIMFIAGM